jgi:hypothetical protein
VSSAHIFLLIKLQNATNRGGEKMVNTNKIKGRMRELEIKEQISSLETRVRILQSQSQVMTFYYGKVDFPKFAELIEHDISDLKAR